MSQRRTHLGEPALTSRISRAGALARLAGIPLIAAAAGCSDAATRGFQTTARQQETKLVILGTAGGPVAGLARNMTSNVMINNGAAYVVDCGLGVTSQLVRAGVSLDAVREIFITHHHPDHTAEYGPLLLLSWIAGRRIPVRAFGPPPLAQMTTDYERMQAYTEQQWSLNVGTPPFEKTVVTERTTSGVVMRNAQVTVTCALVKHPPILPAFAYRFDFHDRSIVFSGDTVPVPALVELAKGADVLVHEAMYYPAMAVEINAMALADKLARRAPPDSPQRILESVAHDHSPADQAGAVAAEAGVKTLVLSHFVPPIGVPDVIWRSEAARYFKGKIVVAKDLEII